MDTVLLHIDMVLVGWTALAVLLLVGWNLAKLAVCRPLGTGARSPYRGAQYRGARFRALRSGGGEGTAHLQSLETGRWGTSSATARSPQRRSNTPSWRPSL